MYIINEHGHGKPGRTLESGEVWETGLEGHEWRPTSTHKSKGTAIAVADAIGHHAVVTRKSTGAVVHDNKKAPRSRIDWPGAATRPR